MRGRSSGDVIVGKYRLEKPLARGGMGEVWTAKNLQLDVPVAIKLMSAHALASAELVARFEREAKAAAQLRHPNVVTVHEHGVFEGVPFIAMELLEGQDLSERLKQRGRLSHADALPIVVAICKALRRAHEMGIVHRDLKPANVFLARQDDDEIVKVLDFGIAKLVRGVLGVESTRAGTIMGSPHYMAPEQAGSEGVPIDHRADLWALGVIAFRMLTGKLPFDGTLPVNVLVRICTETPPLCSAVAPDLDPEMDAFFAVALRRDPAERFQSARELAAAFAALAGHGQSQLARQSLTACPPLLAPPEAPPPALPATDARVSVVAPEERAPVPVSTHSADSTTMFHLAGLRSSASAALLPEPVASPGEPVAQPLSQGPLDTFPLCGDAGTMTSANTESGPLPAPGATRTTAIVVAAVGAAVLAIAVVGWAAFSLTGAPDPSADSQPPPPARMVEAATPEPPDARLPPIANPVVSAITTATHAPAAAPTPTVTATHAAAAAPTPTVTVTHAAAAASTPTVTATHAPAVTATLPPKKSTPPPRPSPRSVLAKPTF